MTEIFRKKFTEFEFLVKDTKQSGLKTIKTKQISFLLDSLT